MHFMLKFTYSDLLLNPISLGYCTYLSGQVHIPGFSQRCSRHSVSVYIWVLFSDCDTDNTPVTFLGSEEYG